MCEHQSRQVVHALRPQERFGDAGNRIGRAAINQQIVFGAWAVEVGGDAAVDGQDVQARRRSILPALPGP